LTLTDTAIKDMAVAVAERRASVAHLVAWIEGALPIG